MAFTNIRWQQLFANYRKALSQLEKFIIKGDLSDLEKQGLIKAFEYTYELGWTTLKNYLEYQGISNIIGSRDAIREAFATKLISDGEGGMSMITSRNLTSNSYNESTADEIVEAIVNDYFNLFKLLELTLENLMASQIESFI